MTFKPRNLSSLLKLHLPFPLYTHYQQTRFINKVRLKWVKNRSFDHIIDKETDLKAAMLLKDAIKRSPTGFITARTAADWQRLLGLTVPVLRFLRRYPTLFCEFPHSRYPNLSCFRLTDTASLLDEQEQLIHSHCELGAVERVSRVLMMMKSRVLPLQSLHPLKWDLGLPDNFEKLIVPKYPDQFRVVKGSNGLPCLRLLQWREEFSVSELQRRSEESKVGDTYRQFRKGQTTLSFPMNFPRGYGMQKKVKAWMEEFQKLPYISPYEDSREIEPDSDLMEKRVVGVLHEVLNLMIHKKTKRNYVRSLREELNLPHRFTRIFTRYPGIFYLSLKCKTTTVVLREGYRRGKLVDHHPLARLREKFHHVMRTGLLYRGKAADFLSPQDCLLEDVVGGDGQNNTDTEEEGSDNHEEWCEEEVSNTDDSSDD